MAIYLVDTENTSQWWTICQEHMQTGDKVILFYTKSSESHLDDFSMFDALSKLSIPVQFVKCYRGTTGDNSLDFQLVSYLGYLIAQDDTQVYYIVTNDGGYDAVVSFWQQKNVHVLRIVWKADDSHVTVSGPEGIVAVRSDMLDVFGQASNAKLELSRLIPDEFQGELDNIVDLFQTVVRDGAYGRRAIIFRNMLTKAYGLHDGSMLYNNLKPYAAPVLKATQSPFVPAGDTELKSDIKPAPDASVISGTSLPASEPRRAQYTWEQFVAYVNSHQKCAVYAASLAHDFPAYISKNTAQSIMALMAWAIMWHPGSERIRKVMAALDADSRRVIGGTPRKQIHKRLSTKMSKGVWPDFVKNQILVSGVPDALR